MLKKKCTLSSVTEDLHSHIPSRNDRNLGSKYAQRVWTQNMPKQPLHRLFLITPELSARVEDAVASTQSNGLKHMVIDLLTRNDTVHWADHIGPDEEIIFDKFQTRVSCKHLTACREEGPDITLSFISRDLVDFGIGLMLLASDSTRNNTKS